jgi:hypothetical protein
VDSTDLKRRLPAIFAADAAGHSRLMARDVGVIETCNALQAASAEGSGAWLLATYDA